MQLLPAWRTPRHGSSPLGSATRSPRALGAAIASYFRPGWRAAEGHLAPPRPPRARSVSAGRHRADDDRRRERRGRAAAVRGAVCPPRCRRCRRLRSCQQPRLCRTPGTRGRGGEPTAPQATCLLKPNGTPWAVARRGLPQLAAPTGPRADVPAFASAEGAHVFPATQRELHHLDARRLQF